MDAHDFPLPPLHPFLRITQAPQREGESSWTLHHPISNQYFQIDWLTYECLIRFGRFRQSSQLIESIHRETTLMITSDQLKDIIRFLHRHHLLDERIYQSTESEKKKNPFVSLLKNYLFFTIPILQPQNFLNRTYPRLSWLFHEFVVKGLLLFLAAMILITLPRIDEFMQSFAGILSLEGIVQIGATFFCIKIIHEFAHAFTATRYGVAVPRMGIAFMVLYPVLYTEASAAWQLSSRRHRFHIAVAGIVAELCVAGIFLLLWNFAPSGSFLQSVSFMVVTVSLIGSLLINLNPLMRFDGYYILSDLLGYENLQQRACQFTRWRLRRFLFDITQPKPENITLSRERFLTIFGFALIIYRFFLFVGIALLVYHVFFQPLGLFLMLVEIGYFILLPLFLEISEWYKMRKEIIATRRGKFFLVALALMVLYFILPVQSQIRAPAVLHATEHKNFYAPASAQIVDMFVENGDAVYRGQKLMTLTSDDLERRIALARAELEKLRNYQQKSGFFEAPTMRNVTSEMIDQAQSKLDGLISQKENLTLVSTFDGVIKDMDESLARGQFVKGDAQLFTVINPLSFRATAYVTESQKDRLDVGDEGQFIPYTYFSSYDVQIEKISATSSRTVTWKELSSLFAGPIASDRDTAGLSSHPIARQGFYEVALTMPQSSQLMTKSPVVQKGWVEIKGKRESLFIIYINKIAVILRQENLLPVI